jgi:hypothetical protein
MNAVPFDTLKLADRLRVGGFTAEQAHAAASALTEVAAGAEIATKRDLFEIEQRLTSRLCGLIVVAVGIILAAFKDLPAPPHL